MDLSNAKLSLIRAENALRIARVILNNAMGTPDASAYTIEDTLSFRKNPITFEEAKQRAYANRPTSNPPVEAGGGRRVHLARPARNLSPCCRAMPKYARVGETYPPEQSGWSAGVTFTFPLFSGS